MSEQAVDVPGELKPEGGWGHSGVVAIRKSGVPGWTPFRWERAGEDGIYTGGVEGKRRDGKAKWAKPHTRIVVTRAERIEAEARYEALHGRCRVCLGAGQEWVGWNVETGNKLVPCSRCKATGRPTPEVSRDA